MLGDASRRRMIREENRLSLRIVMVRECDPDKSGCPFSQSFAPRRRTSLAVLGTKHVFELS